MEDLDEREWFTEKWATSVRDAVRLLVRAYAETLEAVDDIAKPIQRVVYHGFRGGRAVWILKSLLREAVIHHIQTVLRSTAAIRVRAYAAARPTPKELGLGVKRTAPQDIVDKAIAEHDAFVKRQELIAKLLQEAASDIAALQEAVGTDAKSGQKAFRAIANAIRRFLPLAWTGFVVTQFAALAAAPQWQLLAFVAISVVAYHFLAWLTLPFYHAADRQYVLFEGYMGTASDGLDPMHPPVSRLEKALFKLLGSRPPIVVSWEILIPPMHYVIVSILLAMMIIKLPFDPQMRAGAAIFGFVLILWYVSQIRLCWLLIRGRHRDRSAAEILWALLLGAHSTLMLEDSTGKDEAPEKHEDTSKH